jgi:hypothetical protein
LRIGLVELGARYKKTRPGSARGMARAGKKRFALCLARSLGD